MPTPTPPEAIDLLLAAGALERAALTANPARRCPLERVAEYLRKLATPIERKPISEWRARVAPLDAFPSIPPAAAWDAPVRFEQREPWLPATPAPRHFCCGERCPGLDFSVKERAHPPSCLGDTQTHQGRTRAELELEQLERCEDCGAALLHVAGENVSGTVCAECNRDSSLLDDDDDDDDDGDHCPDCHRVHTSDAIDELCKEEKAERELDELYTIEVER